MNTTSASPVDSTAAAARGDAWPVAAAEAAAPNRRILVWDLPVRVFHWLAVGTFAAAWVTAESERWRLLHVTMGYTLGGLVAFRVLWGFVGSRHARFASFVRGPAALASYFRSMFRRDAPHFIGHNPAGAIAIVALLVLAAAITGSGWAAYNDVGGEVYEELHEGIANLMLAVIGVHVAGVLFGSWLHRENLIGAMISGTKMGRPADAARSAWSALGILMICAVAVFWWLQWRGAP
jgi:cytochrome b